MARSRWMTDGIVDAPVKEVTDHREGASEGLAIAQLGERCDHLRVRFALGVALSYGSPQGWVSGLG